MKNKSSGDTHELQRIGSCTLKTYRYRYHHQGRSKVHIHISHVSTLRLENWRLKRKENKQKLRREEGGGLSTKKISNITQNKIKQQYLA